MADPAPATSFEFQFVNSTVNSPAVPQDLAIRVLIRKQAMKKASAARRRDGNYGKHNLRQYPVFVDENGTSRLHIPEGSDTGKAGVHVSQRTGAKKQDTNSRRTSKGTAKEMRAMSTSEKKSAAVLQRDMIKYSESIPTHLSPKGYESMSMRSDFDILDLSTLATLHIGRAVRAALSQNPSHLIHQLRSHKRWSYLSYLPTRYGHIDCLKDATDCVIARARQIISPGENWEAAVIAFYVKALDSLQRALDCPTTRFQPEVLCATEILSLYELLDPSGETAWIRHAAGASKLVLLRGPKNYSTEFEKALFMAQTVPTMTECLLNGERCFLEQSAWQKVMKSVIEPGALISDRSETVLSLLMLKSNIPGFFFDVTQLVCVNTDPEPEAIEGIARRIRQLRTNFLDWRVRYEVTISQLDDMSPGSPEHDSHCKVFSNFLSCLMISSRLLAAVSSSERLELEDDVQSLVNEMFKLEQEVANSPTSLFMAQTMFVAQATKATTDDWRDVGTSPDETSKSNGLIERSKLERWCKLFGRKIP